MSAVAQPVGLGFALLGMAMIGEGHWLILGAAIAAFGVVLLFAGR